jgi:hypothetical protein
VAGTFNSATAGFGTASLTTAGSADMFVAKLTDAGATASFVWAQRAGGNGNDLTAAMAVNGTSVYVAGAFNGATAGFSAVTISNPSPLTSLGFLAFLTDLTLTGTATSRGLAPVQLFPNPARFNATLCLPAGAVSMPLTLTDALGRNVRCYPAPASLGSVLDLHGLPAGLYLLQGTGPALRLVVE